MNTKTRIAAILLAATALTSNIVQARPEGGKLVAYANIDGTSLALFNAPCKIVDEPGIMRALIVSYHNIAEVCYELTAVDSVVVFTPKSGAMKVNRQMFDQWNVDNGWNLE